MQLREQINNKNLHGIVSATLLLVTFLTVLFIAFSPSVAPKAHAGLLNDVAGGVKAIGSGLYGAGKAALGLVVDTVGDAVGDALDATLGKLFSWIGKLIFWITSIFFSIASGLLDLAIAQSLDSSIITNLTSINEAWGLVRDVINMFFIFILLYIAISTILQATSFNWKKTLGNLIIAALLINFSMFFTKVIIDISNVFAMTFYNSMETDINGNTFYGPSVILKEGLNLETTFDSIDQQSPLGPNRIELNNMTRGIIWIFGAIFQMVAAFVFLAGAFIFIKRTISFIFLLIFSPVGFVGFVLPATQKYSNMWWQSLTENAVIAPVFLFMIYIVCGIIRSGNLVSMNNSDQTSLAVAFTGEGSNFTIILQFMILIGLIWFALSAAQAVSEKTASSAIKFAGGITGGMLAGTAIAGRAGGGRMGRMIAENESVKRLAESGNKYARGAGRMLLQGGDAASKSSWDIRKGKYGDPIGGTLGAVSSTFGKGDNIKTSLGQNWGEGGRMAAIEASKKARTDKEVRIGNMLSTDAITGKPRMVEDPFEPGQKITARELHARSLERRADKFEDNAKDPAFERETLTSTRKYLDRDNASADKKAAELVRKGDKDSREAIRKEEISILENSLKEATSTNDLAGIEKIMKGLSSEHIKDIDKKILVQPQVAVHLDIGGLKTLQKTATQGEKDNIREAFVKATQNIPSQTSSIVGPNGQPARTQLSKENASLKRTADWISGARGAQGGGEF